MSLEPDLRREFMITAAGIGDTIKANGINTSVIKVIILTPFAYILMVDSACL